jgi:hypothetical protein
MTMLVLLLLLLLLRRLAMIGAVLGEYQLASQAACMCKL